ncbi:spondin domain-containing protein [uncultured Algibacter sp.]|uniref:T9SS type A sorting domain-containing protein n=1 Tax=uncultured Algibacter sp. TaxID=298659 RepID=UPI003217BCD6
MKKITLTLSLLYLASCFSAILAQSTATYTITFTNFWNETDHTQGGTSFPNLASAHWSDVVGVNHNDNITFFEMGGISTLGVEDIAEFGDKDLFMNNDVQLAIDADNAEQFINLGDLFIGSENSITLNNIEIKQEFPLLSMLSMIAPSPDWMMAINSLNLREGDSWKPSIVMDLFPYDAGTENGSTYSLSNPATSPRGNITSLMGVAPFNNEKVAQITITLESVLSNNDVTKIEDISIFPNPTHGEINISNVKDINLKAIEVYDFLGRLVKNIPVKSNSNKIKADLSSLNKGGYLLNLKSDNGNKTQKLIIN